MQDRGEAGYRRVVEQRIADLDDRVGDLGGAEIPERIRSTSQAVKILARSPGGALSETQTISLCGISVMGWAFR